MESGMTGFKGQGLSAFDKKPLAERFGNKQVTSIAKIDSTYR
jgi:hypothetical protein